jgi:hypothetical protein
MKPSFWKVLEDLGASGSALCNWRHCLGADWDVCRYLLGPTGRSGRHVVDPAHPQRKLDLMIHGEEDFVAVDDDPSTPPIPYKAADVVEMEPLWEPVARALTSAIRFDFGVWETQGHLRRVGSSQDAFGRVTPVLLFLPPGYLGDCHGLLRALVNRTDSRVLLPNRRWFSPEMEALRSLNRLDFIDVAQCLNQFEANPAAPVQVPRVSAHPGASRQKSRAALHGGNGLAWPQVQIELTGNQTIRLSAPGQEATHTFSKRNQLGPEHPLGILMTLAAKGEWRNPSAYAPEYERVSKAFQRLQHLLRALVPVPGKPFNKVEGGFIPVFQIKIHSNLLKRNEF